MRKPHVGVVGVSGVSSSSSSSSSSRTLQPSGSPVSPSQSYSGLGPGRGGSSTRPQSPLKTPAPPAPPVQRPPSSSNLQPSQPKSYPAPKPAAPKPPVNTEIMKKSLRFVTDWDSGLVLLIKCKVNIKSRHCPTSNLDPFHFNCGNFHWLLSCQFIVNWLNTIQVHQSHSNYFQGTVDSRSCCTWI